MKELVNQNSIDELKKSRLISVICIVISLVIAGGLMVPLFLFVNRNNKLLIDFLLALLCTLEATFILYTFVVSIIPVNHYINLSILSVNGNKYLTKGKVVDINSKVTHYKGVAVKEIKIIDLEVEEEKEYIFYVEQHLVDNFKVEEAYSFVTYQSLIISYEKDV